MQSSGHICGTAAAHYDAADNLTSARLQHTCLLCRRPFCENCGNSNAVVCNEDHEKYFAEHPELTCIYPSIRVRFFSLQHKQRCVAEGGQGLVVEKAPVHATKQGQISLLPLVKKDEESEVEWFMAPLKPARRWGWRLALTENGVMMVKCEIRPVRPFARKATPKEGLMMEPTKSWFSDEDDNAELCKTRRWD